LQNVCLSVRQTNCLSVCLSAEFSTAVDADVDSYVGFLPWWVAIIVWVVAIVASIIMAFFIILYTFSFGLAKTNAWCVAVLTSFFFGLLLEQPLKIILVAFAMAFICRKATDIYPTELDIVADHSVRGTFVCLSVSPSLSLSVSYPVYTVMLARRAGSTSCYMLAGRATSMFARCLLDV